MNQSIPICCSSCRILDSSGSSKGDSEGTNFAIVPSMSFGSSSKTGERGGSERLLAS